jgi:hypothetical protein
MDASLIVDVDAERYDEEDLKELSLKVVFGTFSLQKRRRIALDLLNDAEIVTGIILPEANPEFTRWICLGKTKVWPKKEFDRMWAVWNFVFANSPTGNADLDPVDRTVHICPQHFHVHLSDPSKRFTLYNDGIKGIACDQEIFIAAVYKNITPDNVTLCGGGGEDYDMWLELTDPATTVAKLVEDQWDRPVYVSSRDY